MPTKEGEQFAKDIEAELARLGGADKEFEANSVNEVAEQLQNKQVDTEEQQPEQLEHEEEGTDAGPQNTNVLAEQLRAKGYDVPDDATDAELTEALLGRMAKADQIAKEAAAKSQETERRLQELLAKAEQKQTPAQPEPAKQPEEKPKRKLPAALERPDPNLEPLVEWDEESRMFVGKDRYGTAGLEAAKQFNDYRAARAKREQEIVDNPASIFNGLTEDLEERLLAKQEQILEARLQAKLDEIRRQQEEASGKSAAQREEEEFGSFMESVKDKLYKLDPKGQPRKTLDDEPAWTDMGKLFRDEYNDLAQLSPNASPTLLAKKAFERVSKFTSLVPQKTPAEQAAEKKKSFVAKGRKHESGVPSSQNSATVQDKFASGNNVSLLAAMLEDEANDDNPDLAALRKL